VPNLANAGIGHCLIFNRLHDALGTCKRQQSLTQKNIPDKRNAVLQ
jgi:hypothetical protein